MFNIIDSSNSINNTSDNNTQGALELAAGDNLLVQNDGYILATGSQSDAVYLNGYGSNDTITVNGLIMGTDSGIYSLGQYAVIRVNGQVIGNLEGVSVSSGAKVFVSAAGLISGGEGLTLSGNSTLINDGDVNGTENDAIQLSSGTINNNGLISSSYSAVFYDGDGAGRITNTGTIQGDLETYYQASASTAQLTIINSGTWNGDLDLTPGNDTVTNSGHIAGSVTLGDGINTLDSRHGQVDGTIYGGSGVDTILAGNDGETMYGGAGRDQLYGGAGSDTFIFASLVTGDADRVRGFNVANDTIELASSVYKVLKPDTVPAFSIAAAPTSASDFLFYNTSTGNLYYDADGSGTKGVAHLVATLDPGLNVTASNFTIV